MQLKRNFLNAASMQPIFGTVGKLETLAVKVIYVTFGKIAHFRRRYKQEVANHSYDVNKAFESDCSYLICSDIPQSAGLVF